MLGQPPQPVFAKLLLRARSERHAPCFTFFMVIAIIVTSWVGFSTIICLAFARVAARPRPRVGDDIQVVGEHVSLVGDNVSRVGGDLPVGADNVSAEVEASGRQTQNPELKAVCATS